MFNLLRNPRICRPAAQVVVERSVVRASPMTQRVTFASKPNTVNDDADPTPDKREGGADRESTSGDSGSADQITKSEAAYDPNTTRPQDSASQIEGETDKDMSRSAANKEFTDSATMQNERKNMENRRG